MVHEKINCFASGCPLVEPRSHAFLVSDNKIPNVFRVQQCPATGIVQVEFLAFAAQIRIRPVALPEKPQKIFSDDHGYRSEDEKALGVAE